MDHLPCALHTVVCRELWPLILQAPLNWVLISSVLTTTVVTQMAKNLPTVWETWVRSLGWEDSLEKGMAIHSSILAWRIPWTGELAGLQFTGCQRLGHN